MIKLSVCLLFLLLIIGCSKENIDTKPSQRLKNCKISYLLYNDGFQVMSDGTYILDPWNNPADTCYFFYNNSGLNMIKGGLVPNPMGQGYPPYIFTLKAYDSIHHSNKNIFVTENYPPGDTMINFFEEFIYNLNDLNQLVKLNIRNTFAHNGFDLYYQITDSVITESFNNNVLRRTFYFENKNLVRVTSITKDPSGANFSKSEILFEDFDDHPNPFRNMYFMRGAFYRAFSENNYRKYTINKYYFADDSTWHMASTFSKSMPVTYNSEGYPEFGEYE